MASKTVCPSCSAEVQPADRFCSSCGTKLGGEVVRSVSPLAATGERGIRCNLCGNLNAPDASFCESCGNALRTARDGGDSADRPRTSTGDGRIPSVKALQSWKLTLTAGIILAAVLFVTKVMRNDDTHVSAPQVPPPPDVVLQQIQSLEKTVNANPDDKQALLELANRLHDARLYSRAITVYQRYLERDPADADARVDLGISYFEWGLVDSVRRGEYFGVARREMEQAVRHAPKHQLACYNLGIVNLHAGDVEKATEWFKKCVDIDPNSDSGKKAQMLLNQHSFNQPS